MALKRTLKPNGFLYLKTGGAVQNLSVRNCELLYLSPEECLERGINENNDKKQSTNQQGPSNEQPRLK